MSYYSIQYEKPSGIFIEGKECKWHWCSQCKSVSLSFPCCENSSCNCGGCDKCIDISKRVGVDIAIPNWEDLEMVKVDYTIEEYESRKKLNEIFGCETDMFKD
jgi:hypothetical protein